MLIISTFANLVVIDVMLNMFYYLLIFVAAVRLRQKEPGLERPFRIWGNTAVLVADLRAGRVHRRSGRSAPTPSTRAPRSSAARPSGSRTCTIGWYGIGGFIGLVAGPIAYVIFKLTLRPSAAVPPEAPAGEAAAGRRARL